MSELKETIVKSGIQPGTPKQVLFGAGTLHKGFSYGEHYVRTWDTKPVEGKTYYEVIMGKHQEFSGEVFSPATIYYEKKTGYNFAGTLIGATRDGVKLSIVPEYTDLDVDGATVKTMGLTVKTGETATMETTLIEINAENTVLAINGYIDPLGDSFAGIPKEALTTVVKPKEAVSKGDYIENLAYVGHRIDDDGKQAGVIVIFKNALCTSGFEIEGKNKEVSGMKVKFECYADLSNNPTTLPYEIIYLDYDWVQ